jgi:subtilisin family serine protease
VKIVFASAACLAAFAASSSAALGEPGKISVGVAPGASLDRVAEAIEEATGGQTVLELGGLDAVVVSVPDVEAGVDEVSELTGVEFSEPTGTRRLTFTPNDPRLGDQWYVPYIRAFDFWPSKPGPPPTPVRVAVIDSGIAYDHPELAGKVATLASFVGTSPKKDAVGHGTMVAGEIAAALDNGQGIAGVGFDTRLVVAKVVRRDSFGEYFIPIDAEVRAIRWAVDRGARVINLSLGGPRDPRFPAVDSYSALERAAIDYATRKGVVVVAAAGNGGSAYVDYPAALPHALGVSALEENGKTPWWSNRGRGLNDLAAPGVRIVTTRPSGYVTTEGTSFSAPLVAAAAAQLLRENPALHRSQVTALLDASAVDIGPRGRDRLTGRGRLDLTGALDLLGLGTLPPRDSLEPNDETGSHAYTLRGQRRTVRPTITRFHDQSDVYRIYLRKGQRGVFTFTGPAGADTDLYLWPPGTRTKGVYRRPTGRVAASLGTERNKHVIHRARRKGWYFLEVRITSGPGGQYRLSVRKG